MSGLAQWCPGPHADPLGVENLGEVVGMDVAESEGEHAAAPLRVRRRAEDPQLVPVRVPSAGSIALGVSSHSCAVMRSIPTDSR